MPDAWTVHADPDAHPLLHRPQHSRVRVQRDLPLPPQARRACSRHPADQQGSQDRGIPQVVQRGDGAGRRSSEPHRDRVRWTGAYRLVPHDQPRPAQAPARRGQCVAREGPLRLFHRAGHRRHADDPPLRPHGLPAGALRHHRRLQGSWHGGSVRHDVSPELRHGRSPHVHARASNRGRNRHPRRQGCRDPATAVPRAERLVRRRRRQEVGASLRPPVDVRRPRDDHGHVRGHHQQLAQGQQGAEEGLQGRQGRRHDVTATTA